MIRGIIVEGIDCGGKSTLIQSIKFKLKRLGGYDVKSLEHKNYVNQFRRYLYEYASNDKIIFDRSHFSEVVFGKFLRNEISFSKTELKILNEIVKLEFITILALPNYDDFCKRMRQTKTLQVINEKDFFNINKKFEKILNASNIGYKLYRSDTIGEMEELSDKILQMVKRGNKDAPKSRSHPLTGLTS